MQAFRVAFALAISAVQHVQGAMIQTPFGDRPEECVVEVPHNSLVEERDGSLHISHPLQKEVTVYEVPPHCLLYQPQNRNRRPPQNEWGTGCDLNSTQPQCRCNDPPCTCNKLPCNNWIDNAGLFTYPQAIGGFSSTYIVPQTPLGHNRKQCIFYFIGAENDDGRPKHGKHGPGGLTILQPVLTYGCHCQNSTTGWCMSSWNCCPAGVTTHSPYIQDIQPGSAWIGKFNQTSPGIYEIVSRSTTTSQESILRMAAEGRIFDWADVSLEIYSIEACDQFPGGRMTFQDLELWNTDLQPIQANIDNKWLYTGAKPCGGTIKPYDGDKNGIVVEHCSDASTFE